MQQRGLQCAVSVYRPPRPISQDPAPLPLLSESQRLLPKKLFSDKTDIVYFILSRNTIPMALNIKISSFKGIPLVDLIGRITDTDARELSNELYSLNKLKSDRILINIGRVIFIDSHGLGVIVYYSSLLEKENRKLVIINTNRNPSAYINRLFEMTNLNKILTIVSSPE
ncbi:MAG: STAS domain-containing protein [Chitinivibrionales bacterium]|nr:STAS domain-containing protein [Chitinivibrionales bacterium]